MGGLLFLLLLLVTTHSARSLSPNCSPRRQQVGRRGGRRWAEPGDDDDPLSGVTDESMMAAVRKLTVEELTEADDEWDLETMPELPEEYLEEERKIEEEHDRIAKGLQAVSEWTGEFHGIDDPLDAPWRREAEAVIREAIARDSSLALDVVDVMWDYGLLKITVDSPDGVDVEDTALATKLVTQALDIREDDLTVLERFNIEVTSPGASDVLSTTKDFETFKGFDVEVRTLNPLSPEDGRILIGKLVERNSLDLVINQRGAMVRIPFHLVDEVKLPPPHYEHDGSIADILFEE